MAAAQAADKASASNDFRDLDLNDEDDLFDAVLTGSVDKEKTVFTSNDKKKTPATANAKPIPTDASKATKPPKRLSLYIGNFPWWISDVDILNLAQTLGVKDMIEIKFAENKVNGQSRGYVEVVVTSEESMKLLLEKIPQCRLGGEKIDCRYANRHNLSVFEDKANDRIPQRAGSGEVKESNSFFSREPCPPTMPQHFVPQFPNTFPPLPGQFLGQPAPPFPRMPPTIPPPPFMFPNHPTPVPNLPPPSPHTNPAMAGSSHDGHSSKFNSKDRPTDADFDDLMNRNRAVASSAISKAVSGATTGDLRVAMETLLTAIAIIKQSKVYRDDRCQALVTSLKDCLVSIQGNYGYRSSSLSGERERDRGDTSREERTSRRPRERSRSQEREARSNERNRHRDRFGDRVRYR